MMYQQIYILLIAVICITLAHGVTKLKKKGKKLAQRQGLEVSIESKEAIPVNPGQESVSEYPTQDGGDQKLSLNENMNQEYDENNLAHIDEKEKEFENDDEDGFVLDIESEDYDSKEMIMLQGKGSRSLEAGDIFTAQEMLPIAVRLMDRAKSNGTGKGIVTSQTNPKSLADNLFEKYFFKMKRIVVLKDEDFSGLDALQALALSGTVSSQRSIEKYIGSNTDLKERGAIKFPDSTEFTPRRKSRYRLLTKPFYNKIRRVSRRRDDHSVDGNKARMVKKRKVVVDPKRSRLMKKLKTRKGQRGQSKNPKRNKIVRQGQKPRQKTGKTPIKMDGSKTKRFCRWKYGCEDQLVLETCRLSMDCSEEAKSKDYLGIKLLPHEIRENLAMLRTWAGVDVIDTEVEKILENRYNQLIYTKLGNIQMSESIADYFNNLIHFQKHAYLHNDTGGPTTPMYLSGESSNPHSSEEAQGSQVAQLNGQDAQEGPAAQSNDQDAQEGPAAQSNGVSGEQDAQEGAQSNGLSGEVAASELADTETRRKFLSDHKNATTSEKLTK